MTVPTDFILVFNESTYIGPDEEFYAKGTYRISTRKLGPWREASAGNDFAYGYVEDLVDACLAGKTNNIRTGRKYSFGDTPEWWDALEPDADCVDPVKTLDYDVIR